MSWPEEAYPDLDPWCSVCDTDIHPEANCMWVGVEYLENYKRPRDQGRPLFTDALGEQLLLCQLCFYQPEIEQDFIDYLLVLYPTPACQPWCC